MLTSLHTTLRRMIYERGQINPVEVEISFERPTRDWLDALTAPTLNLYLYGIEENPDFRNMRPQVTRVGNIATTHMPPARVDLHYMVAAFSTEFEDEYALIWRTLAVLLRYPALPSELLDEEVRAMDIGLLTKLIRVGPEGPALDFWQSLEIPPRPGLIYSVTVPLDLERTVEAPLVLTREARFTRRSLEDEATDTGITPGRTIRAGGSLRIGGVVRDRQGKPMAGVQISIEGRAMEPVHTTEEGRFTLGPLQPGPLKLRVIKPGAKARLVPLVIPSETYDIVVD